MKRLICPAIIAGWPPHPLGKCPFPRVNPITRFRRFDVPFLPLAFPFFDPPVDLFRRPDPLFHANPHCIVLASLVHPYIGTLVSVLVFADIELIVHSQ